VLIDTFTIIAQIINFLILLVLMRRFLYRPILNAMDEREQRITSRLREARLREQEAEQAAASYRELEQELEARREATLREAEIEADERRKEMLKEARRFVDQNQEAWFRAVQQEKEALLLELERRAGNQTCEIARRALSDLANEDLEDHVITVFIDRLRNLETDERKLIDSSITASETNVSIRTAFPLPEEIKDRLSDTVQSVFSSVHRINFEVDPALICGIELRTKGRKIAWSLQSYLEKLGEDLWQVLSHKTRDGRLEAKEID
jgi:F-type H+-transporting ATPase subunit b